MVIPIPWRLRKAWVKIVGEDRVWNKSQFTPNFNQQLIVDRITAHSLRSFSSQEALIDFCVEQISDEGWLKTNKIELLIENLEKDFPHWRTEILEEAKQITSQAYGIYHLKTLPLNEQFNWHGLEKGPLKDQLYMSRPQRFGFAPVICQAAIYDSNYLNIFDKVIENWMQYAKTCPYKWPYNSSHAIMYRLIALRWSWIFISSIHKKEPTNLTYKILGNILLIIANDIDYLQPRLGDAHPNNHILADYFTGWFIQHEYKLLTPVNSDFSQYEALYQNELLKQFYTDGGNFEHAMHYHEHGCEMAVIYTILTSADKIPIEVKERIKKMLRFQLTYCHEDNTTWELGDTTEDTLLPLSRSKGWSLNTIRHILASSFEHQEVITEYQDIDLKTYWLLAGSSKLAKAAKEATTISFDSSPDSGMYYWRNHQTANHLLYRSGVPQTSLFMPGHMHADILSLFWRCQEVDLLAASGTYTYKFDTDVASNDRRYFCGPWSHSTVILNDEDPLGTLAGHFRDNDNNLRVNSTLYQSMGTHPSIIVSTVKASNIYNQLIRGVIALSDDLNVVFDVLTPEQQKAEAFSNWLFGEGITATVEDSSSILLNHENVPKACIQMLGNNEKQLSCIELTKGWLSKKYGTKVTTTGAKIAIAPESGYAAYALTPSADSVITKSTIAKEQGHMCISLSTVTESYTIKVALDGDSVSETIDGLSVDSNAYIHRITGERQCVWAYTINPSNNVQSCNQHTKDSASAAWVSNT